MSFLGHKITVMSKYPTGTLKKIPKTNFFSPNYTLLKWRIIIIIIIKLLQDKDPVEQGDSRHPTIAACDTVSFEASII